MVLHVLAAALYAALALHVWRTRGRGGSAPTTVGEVGRMHLLAERGVLLTALAAHALGLRLTVFNGPNIHFGFAIATSIMLWLAMALYFVESFYTRLDGLQAIGLPVAAMATLLPAVFSEPHVLTNAGSPAFRLHLFAAMLAYSLFTLAALHALLMAAAERRLHRGRLPPLLADLPPLLTMEAMLFRLIHVAFLLLTLTLVSGIFFSEDLFGRALRFDHKTVFAILSWLIFAALLLGRHLRGWRGRIALRWTLTGFAALLLAYVGSRFVLEVILGRVS
jgi:ABC-type uncharacterized transport system permease subunit